MSDQQSSLTVADYDSYKEPVGSCHLQKCLSIPVQGIGDHNTVCLIEENMVTCLLWDMY